MRLVSFRLACCLGVTVISGLSSEATAQWVPDGSSLCLAAGAQSTPAAVPDGTGGAVVVWRDARSPGTTGSDIYATRVTGAGGVALWPTNGVALCTATGEQLNPVAVSDGSGGAIAVWRDLRNGAADVFAMRVQADGLLPPSWPANGLAVCTAVQAQNSLAATSDNAGGAFVAWEDFRNGVHHDIYVQHVLSGGTVDPLWPANGLGICAATADQGSVAIAPDGSGGAVVVWEDSRNLATNSKDLFAQRVTAGGSVLWPANGIPVCDAPGLQESPAIIGDGSGGGLISWADLRPGASGRDIYAHHLIGTGTLDATWPALGAPLCMASGDQEHPVIVSDGGTGAVIAWQDLRNGSDYDVYAQRVTLGGASQWAPDGNPASTSSGFAWEVRATFDGTGGIVMTWTDIFAGDVYAQRLQGDGTVGTGWPMDGLGVCVATGVQTGTTIVSDAAGGAIIAWGDGRAAGNEDVYAQRVTSSGEAGPTTGVSPEAGSRAAELSLSPNPSRGLAQITLVLPSAGAARVCVVDVGGRVIARIVDGAWLPEGTHRFVWPLVSGEAAVAPGIYFVQALTGGQRYSRRFVVVH